MFPELNLDNVVEETEKEVKTEQGKTFLYDFKKGDFILKNGKLVIAEEVEGVKVWIEKILRTEKFNFKVYKTDELVDEYGVTIEKLIRGKKFPVFFLESELKREITEAMDKHVEIERIENFNIRQDMVTLYIYFTVILKDGNSFEQEVSF